MPTFGERIKQIRIEKNILQKNTAEFLGLNVRTYQYYETGKLEPNLTTISKLADYFDVSIDYLVGRSDNPERN